jgi:hypothetical protein
MTAGNEDGALAELKEAVKDYNACEYRKLDKRTIWIRAIESCQLLAELHRRNGRAEEATEAHERALHIATELEPRMKGNATLLSLVALSRKALATPNP